MGEHFALALRLTSSRRAYDGAKKVRKARSNASLSLYGTAIFVVLCIMVLGYLIQVNAFSTKGYEIRDLENQVSTLQDEQKKLEIDAANLRSLQRLEQDNTTVNMVPVTSVSYLQTSTLSQR